MDFITCYRVYIRKDMLCYETTNGYMLFVCLLVFICLCMTPHAHNLYTSEGLEFTNIIYTYMQLIRLLKISKLYSIQQFKQIIKMDLNIQVYHRPIKHLL